MVKNKKFNISKYLQVGLLFCFLLPFFPQGCQQKMEESSIENTVDEESIDEEIVDEEIEDNAENTMESFPLNAENKNEIDTETEEKNEEVPSMRIAQKSNLLRYVLRPNDNYTGVATLIDLIPFINLGYGLGIAFILFFLALVIKFKDFNNIFILLNVLGLIFLSFSHSTDLFSSKRLWGFWFCLAWCVLMIMYDLILLKKIKQFQTHN